MLKKSLKTFVLFVFLGLPAIGQELTAEQIVKKIKSELTCDWSHQTVDTFKAGKPETIVTGVASTFMATLDVLKEAKARGCNFVITHEPTFYNHLDDLSIHENDEIQKAKLKFINENNMIVWRFHDHMHRTDPDQIYAGVINQLEWSKFKKHSDRIFVIPSQSLSEIVEEFQLKTGATTLRVVGDPKENFTKVGFVLGAAGTGAHFNMLANPDCELLVIGETNEWETVPYIQDAISLGKKKALIVMGHADSEEAGMVYFNQWLKEFYPQTKIEFIRAGNPYWNGSK